MAAPTAKRAAILAWFSSSSAAGFSRLTGDAVCLWKVFWGVIIAAAYCGLTVHSVFLFLEYFRYPVSLQILPKFKDAEMPDVTICRSGIFHMKYLKSFPTDVSMASQSWGLVYNKNPLVYNHPLIKVEHYKMASIFEKYHHFSDHIAKYLIFCSYKGVNCDFRNFTKFVHPIYQDCFTFQPTDRRITSKGIIFSLLLDSYLPPDSDWQWLNGNGRLVVSLQERDTIPDPASEGYEMRPGRRTLFRFKSKTLEKVDSPVSRCSNKYSVQYSHASKRNFQLTQEDCVRRYGQNKMVAECGCKSPFYLFWDNPVENCFNIPSNCSKYPEMCLNVETNVNYPPPLNVVFQNIKDSLFTNNTAIFRCHQKVWKQVEEEAVKIPCSSRCTSTQVETSSVMSYDVFTREEVNQLSNGGFSLNTKMVDLFIQQQQEYSSRLINFKDYITKLSILNFKDEYGPRILQIGGKNVKSTPKFREKVYNESLQRLIQLDFYTTAVPVDSFRESFSYPLVSLLSEFGGILGLWTGVSVISTCELLELICLLCTMCCRNRKPTEEPEGAESVPL